MPIYIKPSGVELYVDENSESYAQSIGWKRKEEVQDKPEEPKRKGRPKVRE